MSKAKRLLKVVAVSALSVLAGAVLLVAWSFLDPPTYEAETELRGTRLRLAVQIQPMHPYLAEYHRYLELRQGDERIDSIELVADSGGYSRTQLYALPSGDFLVLGYFDAVRVGISPPAIMEADLEHPERGEYLGAFERDVTGQWRFAHASVAPEVALIPRGG